MTAHTFARRTPMFAAIGIALAAVVLLLAEAPASEAASRGTVATHTTVDPTVWTIGSCPAALYFNCYNGIFRASVVAEGGEVVINGGSVTFYYRDRFVCSVSVHDGAASCTHTFVASETYLGRGVTTAAYSGYSGPPGWNYLPSSGSFDPGGDSL